MKKNVLCGQIAWVLHNPGEMLIAEPGDLG